LRAQIVEGCFTKTEALGFQKSERQAGDAQPGETFVGHKVHGSEALFEASD
jgi:hypothetical protein